MHHFLLALLASFTFSNISGDSLRAVPETTVSYAFEQACHYAEIDCTGIELPSVRFWELLKNYGALGVYAYDTNPDVVWLDVSLEFGLEDPASVYPLPLAILIHEIVHYIDHQANGSEFLSTDSVCASEGLAWYSFNRWVVDNGFAELARWNWRDVYPTCQ